MRVTVQPLKGSVKGSIRPPSDKSLTHRAFMFGAAARTASLVRNPLFGEDCLSTLRILEQMGLSSAREPDGSIRLTPAACWQTPAEPLDCGNSGTTMRLISGMISSRAISATLTGDESLSKRPMRRIAEPLRLMGATVVGDTAPLSIQGTRLQGISYSTPIASAQIKSCILLAGVNAEGETTVTEPELSRDHTERMLESLGVAVRRDGLSTTVSRSEWDGFETLIPADISSAAFFMVLAAAVPGSSVKCKEVGTNPTRAGILEVFAQASCEVDLDDQQDQMGEPTATLIVRSPSRLKAFSINGALVPRLIDEIPVLAVLATQCEGETVISDASELRHKESDRIAKVCEGLAAMGANIEARPDGMVIQGPTPLTGATIDAHGDHRIAMAFAIAGMIAESGETIIDGADSIATSYPNFWEHVKKLT